MQDNDTALSQQLDEFLSREIPLCPDDKALGSRSLQLAMHDTGEKPYLDGLRASEEGLSTAALAERHNEYRCFFQDALARVGAPTPGDVREADLASLGQAVRESHLRRKAADLPGTSGDSEDLETESADGKMERMIEELEDYAEKDPDGFARLRSELFGGNGLDWGPISSAGDGYMDRKVRQMRKQWESSDLEVAAAEPRGKSIGRYHIVTRKSEKGEYEFFVKTPDGRYHGPEPDMEAAKRRAGRLKGGRGGEVLKWASSLETALVASGQDTAAKARRPSRRFHEDDSDIRYLMEDLEEGLKGYSTRHAGGAEYFDMVESLVGDTDLDLVRALISSRRMRRRIEDLPGNLMEALRGFVKMYASATTKKGGPAKWVKDGPYHYYREAGGRWTHRINKQSKGYTLDEVDAKAGADSIKTVKSLGRFSNLKDAQNAVGSVNASSEIAKGLDPKTRKMVRAWVESFGGDTEKTAEWMRDKLRLGDIKAMRRLVDMALARASEDIDTAASNDSILKSVEAIVMRGVNKHLRLLKKKYSSDDYDEDVEIRRTVMHELRRNTPAAKLRILGNDDKIMHKLEMQHEDPVRGAIYEYLTQQLASADTAA